MKKTEKEAATKEQEEVVEQSSETGETIALEACEQERDSWKERYVRARADLENATRRMEKDRAHFSHLGSRSVLSDLLSIVDDFDRALAEHDADDADKKIWLSGFDMIRTAFYKVLEQHGVTPMTDKQYASFDPVYHEAMMHVDAEGYKAGEIVAVLQKGFMFNDEVLRPAKVSVAK